ncbi:MAG: clostripain-related cysteine peptidase, partial [Bdellovibrionota bacterium]
AASTLKSDLLVQTDTKGPTGIRRFHMFQAPGTAYAAPKGKEQFDNFSPASIKSPLVDFRPETKPATSADHKARMREFLDWGMRQYPADRYFVIVWGHGQGWASNPAAGSIKEAEAKNRYVDKEDLPISFDDLPDFSAPPKEKSPFTGRFGGLVFTETPGDYLGIPALSGVLKSVVSKTLEGNQIDVYAADACLMQMAEVAYEISDSARFVIGSAQIQSFLGLPYRRLMYEINSGGFDGAGALVGKTDEAYLVARMLPKLAEKSLDPVHGQQGRADKEASKTFTMSSISTASLRNELVPAIEDLGIALSAYINEDPLRTMDLRFLMKSTPNFMSGARELGSFIGLLEFQLREEAEAKGKLTPNAKILSDKVVAVRKAIAFSVVNYGFGTGYRGNAEPLHLLGFRSLGIWLPQSPQEYNSRVGDFVKSTLYKDTQGAWAGWLKAVYQ